VDLGPPAETLPQIFGSRTAVAQWGGSPVIGTLELRLLRIAYRRAHGSLELPGPELLDELAHELKNQVIVNTDLRDESELLGLGRRRWARGAHGIYPRGDEAIHAHQGDPDADQPRIREVLAGRSRVIDTASVGLPSEESMANLASLMVLPSLRGGQTLARGRLEDLPDASASKTSLTDVHGTIVKDIIA
jgi:hypothetical protein